MKKYMLKKNGLKCVYCNNVYADTNLIVCNKCGLILYNSHTPINTKLNTQISKIVTYYINLDRDINRNNYMIHNLNKCEINATRFNAINFNKIDPNEILASFPNISNEAMERVNTFIKEVPGSMGCYMSHILLWKKCVDEKYPYMLILEDDIIFNQYILLDVINAINRLPQKWCILHIGSNIVSGKDITQNIVLADGKDIKGVNSGLFGYVINGETIKALLDIMLLFVNPYLDCVLRKYHRYVPVYFMKYKPIKHIDIQQSSRISLDSK